MDFVAVVDQAIALLRQRGRVTYRTLKRQFQLDDTALEDLTVELIKGQRLAADEDGAVLVWIGAAAAPPAPGAIAPAPASLPPSQEAALPQRPRPLLPPPRPRRNAASSPSSSVTWSTRPHLPASSTRKTCARSCAPIKRPAPR